MKIISNFFKTYKIKIILILIIIIICSFGTYFSTTTNPKYKYKISKIEAKKQYQIVKVIDGDTFEISINGEVGTVRMLGIDTPETVDPRKTVQCFGVEASNMTKSLLVGHSVSLGIDKSQSYIDKYGRILAYVYRDDGLFINKYLIENGYAHEYTYGTIPYSRQKEFKELEKTASKSKVGLWGSICNNI
jgi:micrococcal nuclease